MTIHYDPSQSASPVHPRKPNGFVTKAVSIDEAVAKNPAGSAGVRRKADKGSHYLTWGKRVLDLGLVLLASPVIIVLVGLLALLVAADGSNPFYSQLRVGRGGRLYRMWKLRTMVVDAEAELEAHLADNPLARDEWNSNQKLKSDPRITTVGRVLRKCSMDELPQLWNVLIGDMSLVGPRPMMPEQQAIYPGSAYFRLLPGITGPWQVSKRNECTFSDRARFDTSYEQTTSLRTDLGLLWSTIRVVLHGTGY
jgi:exopolysaccharide production protein ExoY